MSDIHDIEKQHVIERVSEVLRKSGSLELHITSGDQSSCVPCVIGEDGLYAVVDDHSAEARLLFDNPGIGFSATSDEGSFTGKGRVIRLESLADESDVKKLFDDAGVNVDTNFRALRVAVEEYRVLASDSSTPVLFPHGGDAKGSAALWWQAVRPFAYTASVTPILLGGVLAWFMSSAEIAWWLLPFVILAGVLYHSAANLISDYYDYKRGVDRAHTMGGSGVLVQGLMRPKQVLAGAIVAFILGTALGLWMVSLRGMPVFYIGLAGFVGGFFYSGWPFEFKYRGLGEIDIFALFGPLMVAGSYIVLTGTFDWNVVYISLPVGFLVTAIVQANNLRDIGDDAAAGITTVSNAFGQKVAAIEYYGLVVGAYVSVVIMIALGILPIWTLIVALSIPPAMKVINVIRASGGQHTSELHMIDEMSAQVHLLFGVLLMIGLTLGKLF
jgi:1,4-dihydroxy-2-naphthoate polyprenyltransferase